MQVSERITAAAGIDDRHRRLVQRILAEEPGVARAADDWQLSTALRRWAYRNIRRQTDYPTLLDQRPEFLFYTKDAPDIFEAFSQDLGGVVGGGCTYALLTLYQAFGFDSLMIDCGVSGQYTRISTLCNIGGTSDPLWVVQDPNYDFALADAAGGPIDIREVIRLLSARRHADIVRLDGDADACREVIMLPEQFSSLADEWTIDPTARPLRVLADGRAVFRSHMTMARYAERAEGSMAFLREKDLPEDLLYFYLLAFAIYPAVSPPADPLFAEIVALQSTPRVGSCFAAYEGSELRLDDYREHGLFVIRGFFSPSERHSLAETWEEFYSRSLLEQRAVGGGGSSRQDLFESPPEIITDLYKNPKILKLVQAIHGPDIIFCSQRVLIKDAHFGAGVPPHQDFSYYFGGMEKTGLFIPLTTCARENGGLNFILRSHKLGYLGDQGYVPPDRLVDGSIPGFTTVCPTLFPGDIALMDVCLLHFSYDATSPDPRVYVNPYYQPASDGSYNTLMSGEWKTSVRRSESNIDLYFKTNAQLHAEELERAKSVTLENAAV
jgi:Phytanoyl-CoA dioxygenase (PhyH)